MPALDGIRGIAILLVLVAHFVGAYEPISPRGQTVFNVLRSGWCGVDLFFVLSGFLITGILFDTKAAPNFFRAFYMRRFLRIFPLYYALLLLWFGVLGTFAARFGWDPHAIGRDRQGWYWLYLSNWMLPAGEPVGAIAHLWSLAVEEQFYLAWPLLVWLVPRRHTAKMCLVLVVVVFGLRLSLSLAGVSSDAIYEWTITRLDSLAMGGLLAVCLRDRRLYGAVTRSWKPLLATSALTLAGIGAYYGRLHFHDRALVWIGYSALALFSAGLIAVAVLADENARSVRLLTWLPLRGFGRYSYGIYVIHFPLFCIVQQRLMQSKWKPPMQTPLGYALFMIVGIAVTYALAALSWHLFEKRILAWKRHFVARGPA